MAIVRERSCTIREAARCEWRQASSIFLHLRVGSLHASIRLMATPVGFLQSRNPWMRGRVEYVETRGFAHEPLSRGDLMCSNRSLCAGGQTGDCDAEFED